MASYYWVGGNGAWNTTATSNWAATSGGAGGAGVPTTADTAIFDANSGAAVVTLGENVSVLIFDASSFAGTIDFSIYTVFVSGNAATVVRGNASMTCLGSRKVELTYSGASGTRSIAPGAAVGINAAMSIYVSAGSDIISIGTTSNVYDINFTGFSGSFLSNNRIIYGSLVFSTAMTLTGFGTLTFGATTAGQTLDFGGTTYNADIIFNGVGGEWTFTRDFVQGATRVFYLTNGTVNGGDKNITLGILALNAGTKTLSLGSGTWTAVGSGPAWNADTNSANFTVNASTGVIKLTNAAAKRFAGGGKTWPTLDQGGAGALTIQQSNTFANITASVRPSTITITSGTTQTVASFTASGTSGNLVTVNASTAGARATLTDAGGTNSVSYLSIKDIAATGGATWAAYTTNGNVDAGNNTGWEFTAPPVTAAVYPISFTSFTERRRF